MNIKTKLIYTMIIAAGLFATKSCSESDDSQITSQDSISSELSYFGIYKKTNNEKVDLSKIGNLTSNISYKNSEIITDETFYYNDGSKAYIFSLDTNNVNENYVIKVNSMNEQISSTSFSIQEFIDDANYQFNVVDANGITTSYLITNGEIELLYSDIQGKRNPGESYGDCIVRTYNEYISDAIGVISAALAPREIMAAIAISCI